MKKFYFSDIFVVNKLNLIRKFENIQLKDSMKASRSVTVLYIALVFVVNRDEEKNTPNFIYILRCSPLWKTPDILKKFDNIIKHTLTTILNIPLEVRSWTQASLTIRLGGLSIRKITYEALPAFVSSVYSGSYR